MRTNQFITISTLVMMLTIQSAFAGERWGISEEQGVPVLTDSNFDNFVKSHEWVFVKFYTPWCGHCKSMAPSYAELALEHGNRDDGIPIAQMDCSIHKKITERFKISGYPTLKLFNRGFAIDFKGGRAKKDIEDFIQLKKQYQLTHIETMDEFEEIQNVNLAGVYYLESKKPEDIEQFRRFALKYDKIPLAYTHNKQIQEKMGGKGPATLIVIRDFDDGHKIVNKDQSFKDSELQEEFQKVRYGFVMEHNDDVSAKVHEEKKPALYLFTDNKYGESLKILRQIAPKYTADFAFVYVDATNEKVKRLCEFLGVTTNENVRLFVEKGQSAFKYKINEINEQNIVQLLDDYKAGKARQYLKSDPVPTNNNKLVKDIVGANFNAEIVKGNKHFLLEIYAPWCGHCKRLDPIFQELANQLSGYPDIQLGKMDGTTNEYPKIESKGYPTILFFPKGKADKPVKYEGEHDIQKFIVFLNRNVGRVHKLAPSNEL